MWSHQLQLGRWYENDSPSSGEQKFCHGDAGCLATQPRSLQFMTAYFKKAVVYKLQNRQIFFILYSWTPDLLGENRSKVTHDHIMCTAKMCHICVLLGHINFIPGVSMQWLFWTSPHFIKPRILSRLIPSYKLLYKPWALPMGDGDFRLPTATRSFNRFSWNLKYITGRLSRRWSAGVHWKSRTGIRLTKWNKGPKCTGGKWRTNSKYWKLQDWNCRTGKKQDRQMQNRKKEDQKESGWKLNHHSRSYN